jgi:rubrerythrin
MAVETILRDAIEGEIEAYELYTRSADLVEIGHIKALLQELAQEELGHRVALEQMLANPAQMEWQVRELTAAPIEDYKIADHLVVRPLAPDSTFEDVCIFAAKKEQQSYELYRGLAEQSSGEARELLAAMAKDELRHKNLVEGWYEEVVYAEF